MLATDKRGRNNKMPRYDVIVVGLGALGSAAAYHLARSGASVLGIDRDDPPHKLGSTHGETRVTRAAIGEGAGVFKACDPVQCTVARLGGEDRREPFRTVRMPHDLRAFGRGHGAPRPGICCQHPQGRNSARYRPRGISRWRIDTPTFSARSRYPHGGKGIASPARGGFSSRNAAYARSSRLRRTAERRC